MGVAVKNVINNVLYYALCCTADQTDGEQQDWHTLHSLILKYIHAVSVIMSDQCDANNTLKHHRYTHQVIN